MNYSLDADRYVNPYTDFGFKMLFGTEINKDLLISFINSLLDGKEVIHDLQYLNTEHLGNVETDRRAVFDVYCENEKGEKILIEMQRGEQQFFKDRSLYYATFPIREQGKKGIWDFELKSVYIISILNFTFSDQHNTSYFHKVQLVDLETQRVFNDKLTFIYLEMPKFNKSESDLLTMFEKWMFVLRNLTRLLERPQALQEKVFTKLFETAEIAHFTEEQNREYEDSLKVYRDWQNTIDTAEKKGWQKGREEGIQETLLNNAQKMVDRGFSLDTIADIIGLSREELEKLDKTKDNDSFAER